MQINFWYQLSKFWHFIGWEAGYTWCHIKALECHARELEVQK